MNSFNEDIINESIKFELQMSEIYTMFGNIISEDFDFWNQLANEEIRHAELIRKIKPFVKLDKELINVFFHASLESLKIENRKLHKIIDEFKLNPERNKAFKIGLEMEKTGIELHYQAFISSEKNSDLSELFKTLNGDDMDHAQRIQEYMSKLNIDK